MLYATDVKIPPDLGASLKGIGTNAYNSIGSNYDAARKKLSDEASARGMKGSAITAPGSYSGQRFGASQGLDVGNLESALGGGLANTGYQDTLAQRDYEQNRQLAEEAGSLNKPDLLQQILGGIGSVGGTVGGIYGAFGKNKSKPITTPTAASMAPPSYYDFA